LFQNILHKLGAVFTISCDKEKLEGNKMQIFLDSADIDEIKELSEWGLIDGVTTNPSLVAKAGGDFDRLTRKICEIVEGDVSIEVIANDYNGMVKQGEKILDISDNIVVKLPVTLDGIRACSYFAENGQKTNMTLCFTANQALLAARAGATYISPFIGRLDDIGQDGMQLIKDIKQVYDNYLLETKILAASIRGPQHVYQSALVGADVATMGGKLIKQLLDHPLTTKGLEIFNKDWDKSQLKI
jgi:transaldolase